LSAGAIFQEALRILVQRCGLELSQNDVLAALKAARPGPLEPLYEAGAEAGLAPEAILSRGAAIFFNFCAGNLADDLSDHECTYLDEPYRFGPCTQFILQNLFFYSLMMTDLPSDRVRAAVETLIAGAGPQHVELRTKQWNAGLFRQVAEGIAGRQWSAYLQILWCNTPLAGRAESVGMKAGIVAHTVKDIRSNDPRYITLCDSDRREIVSWTLSTVAALRAEHLSFVDALLPSLESVLCKAR
jgi:hypothetical protein